MPFQATSAQSINQLDREPANSAGRQVSEVLQRFNRLLFEKDMRVLSEFAEDAILIGSESGAVAVGRTELKAFFERIYAGSRRYSWEWNTIRAQQEHEIIWFFAEGQEIVSEGATEKLPYRLAGVVQRIGGHWVWRQFHGSEPTAK